MIRVAALQMISTADIENNLQVASRLIDEATATGAKFLVLPENFSLMGLHEQDKLAIMEAFGNGLAQDFLSDQAYKHGIWLMGGTIPLTASADDKIRAACLLYNPDGRCHVRYDKIHLFDVSVTGEDEVYNESSTIEAGEDIIVSKTPFGNIGLSVCYDLRFPELYRNMHDQDVHIITAPSAFTYTTGKAHWECLLRTRAIENLCYVIAPNQGGKHINGRETWGHSMILNPWGDILSELQQGEGFALADIDIKQLESLRKNFPTLQHRKLDYIK